MSKVTVALGSFMVGACSVFFMLSGSHTSTFAQVRIEGPGELIVANSVPVVPTGVAMFSDTELDKPVQQIDGLGCVRCILKAPVLAYGGGPFLFRDAHIAGPVRISLTGAAANTFVFMSLVRGVNLVKPPEMPKPNTPILRVATATEPITFSLESPYGQK